MKKLYIPSFIVLVAVSISVLTSFLTPLAGEVTIYAGAKSVRFLGDNDVTWKVLVSESALSIDDIVSFDAVYESTTAIKAEGYGKEITVEGLNEKTSYFVYMTQLDELSNRILITDEFETQERQYRLSYTSNPDIGDGYIHAYTLYLPEEYYLNPNSEWPLLICLHGQGEKGELEYDKLLRHGPSKLVEQGRDFPMIIASPQTYKWAGGWEANVINEFVDLLFDNYRVNQNRLYVTGLSMGGAGTYIYAAAYPERIAAMVPISGWGSGGLCNINMGVWGFHNEGDGTVVVNGTINAINQINGCRTEDEPEAIMTIYPTGGHDAWTKTYDGSAGHDIYTWMLGFTKEVQPNTSPTSITLSPNTVLENLPIGTTIGELIAEDDQSQGHIFALEGTELDNEVFSIDQNYLKSAISFNFSEKSTYQVSISVNDQRGGVFKDTLEIVVLDDPDWPMDPTDYIQADPDDISLNEDEMLAFNVLLNDSTGNGSITITALTTPQNGTLSQLSDSVLLYTPKADYFGLDSAIYTVSNGVREDTAFIFIEVIGQDDLPVARVDSVFLNQDEQVTFDVMSNDEAVDGGLSLVSFTTPQNGTIAKQADNKLRYQPSENYVGKDSIVYVISDIDGDQASAMVYFEILEVTKPLVAVADSFTTPEDIAIDYNVLNNDYSLNGGMVIDTYSQPENGTLTLLSDSVLTYQPNSNYFGKDSATYIVKDKAGLQEQAKIIIEVTAVNDPVVANNDSVYTDETKNEYLIYPLENDLYYDGGEVILSILKGPEHGTAEYVASTFTLKYSLSDQNLIGKDSINYQIEEPDGSTATAWIYIFGEPEVVFIAYDDTVSLKEDEQATIEVLKNDVLSNLAVTLSILEEPLYGRAEVTNNETILYIPDKDDYGLDQLLYTVVSEEGNIDSAFVMLTIEGVNDPVLLVNDTINIYDTEPIELNLLANDYIADGIKEVSYESMPEYGGLELAIETQTFIYQYSAEEYHSEDSFIYTVVDTNGDRSAALVVLLIDEQLDDKSEEAGKKVILTPNNDNKNDLLRFSVVASNQQDYTLEVFNTNGTLIYKQDHYTNDWNGVANGHRIPTGSYFYLLKGEKENSTYQGIFYVMY
ncbi:Ig-like domain-containing protein [Limibacter armeniacum]|uniref:Ig-like domain-containing protein n=1 Tax=Limibacter armeniacum TaxID=466084 RepID=UPI002FE614DC